MADVGGAIALPGGDRFRAVMAAVVPEAVTLTDDEWRDAASIIARAIATRPAGVRRQLGVFLRALDVVALVRHGRGLRALSAAQRTALLDSLSRSRVLALRRGVWGVPTRGAACTECHGCASPIRASFPTRSRSIRT